MGVKVRIYQIVNKKKPMFGVKNKNPVIKSVIDAKEEYLDRERNNSRKKYPESDELALKKFMEFVPPSIGNRKTRDLAMSEISKEIIEDYKAYRANLVEHSTVDRELNVIRHFLYFAKGKRYIKDNPFPEVKLFREDLGRIVYFEGDEINKLLEACDKVSHQAKHLKPIVILDLNTGLRSITLFSLKWKDIDFTENFIYTNVTKNGHRLTVTLNTDAKQALEDWKAQSVGDRKDYLDEYIFKNKHGKPFKHVRKSFYKALKLAGLENKGAVFYSLRHSFCSHLAMKTKDLNLVREAAGHKRLDMTLRYVHLTDEYKKEAMEGIYKKKDGRNLAEIEKAKDLEDKKQRKSIMDKEKGK